MKYKKLINENKQKEYMINNLNNESHVDVDTDDNLEEGELIEEEEEVKINNRKSQFSYRINNEADNLLVKQQENKKYSPIKGNINSNSIELAESNNSTKNVEKDLLNNKKDEVKNIINNNEQQNLNSKANSGDKGSDDPKLNVNSHSHSRIKSILEGKKKLRSKWEEEEDSEESDHQRKKKKRRMKKYSKSEIIQNTPEPIQMEEVNSPYTRSPYTSGKLLTPLNNSLKNNIQNDDLHIRSGSSSPSNLTPVVTPTHGHHQDSYQNFSSEDFHNSSSLGPNMAISQLFVNAPVLISCRSVDNYEKLNRIEEGAYGVVYRAKDRKTGEIIALKKLKLEKEKNGFPTTSLREIQMLLLAKHPNIVNVKEIAIGNDINKVFIAMEFVEHDLKSLMENMEDPFLQSEIKTIMLQLLSAVALLHDNWIIHRDLKTSNVLMNNRGQIKLADFGLARRFGSPMGLMTPLVVTLWYRSPELLLGEKDYTTAIDMWSVGCIFAELVNKGPLFPGKSEIDQLNKIFKLLGTPNEKIWPGFEKLTSAKSISFPVQKYSNLRSRFPYLSENGLNLMSRFLTYDPKKRITAEEALKHPYFKENPLPKDPRMFPTFPSKASGEKRKTYLSPTAPKGRNDHESSSGSEVISASIFDYQSSKNPSTGFRLNF